MILFGFKSCGKSYFGKKLAEALKKPFIDTDQKLVERYPGLNARQIYQKVGEASFRLLEKEILMSLPAEGVIALGGGTLSSQEHLSIAQAKGKLVYLEASFAFLAPRILAQGLPSFIDSILSLQKLYEKRVPFYEQIQSHRISVEQPEAKVMKRLKELAHGL